MADQRKDKIESYITSSFSVHVSEILDITAWNVVILTSSLPAKTSTDL